MLSSKKNRHSNHKYILQKYVFMISASSFLLPTFVYSNPPCSLEQAVQKSSQNQNQNQNLASNLVNQNIETLMNSKIFNVHKEISNSKNTANHHVQSVDTLSKNTQDVDNRNLDSSENEEKNNPCLLELQVGNFKLESGELAPESFQMIKSQIQNLSQNCIQQTNTTMRSSLRGFFWVSIEPTEKYQWEVDIPISSVLKEEQLTQCLKSEIKKLIDLQKIDFNQDVFVSIHLKRH